MNNIDKSIFSSYETVETALLNDLATEVKTKGKKARILKGQKYYVKYDGVWYDVTPEQCRIRKLIRNNYNMFVEQINSAKSDILGVWKNVWGERLPAIIADLEKGIEICQKYFDAFKDFVIKGSEAETEVEETEETVSDEKNEETVTDEKSSNDECERVVVEYKLIEAFEDYIVSSDGKVFSLKHRKMKEMKPRLNKGGYLDVPLCSNGQHVRKLIHRLVARAFISNPDNLPEVNHKDEVKSNNCVDNLEWCTSEYNSNFGSRGERVAKALINHPDFSVPVVCLETGEVYPSVSEASRQTGVHRQNISGCLNGERQTAGGYHWARFVEGDNLIYD